MLTILSFKLEYVSAIKFIKISKYFGKMRFLKCIMKKTHSFIIRRNNNFTVETKRLVFKELPLIYQTVVTLGKTIIMLL